MVLVFIGKDNTSYSQIAEAWAKKHNKNEDLEIYSCGLFKGEKIDSDVVQKMKNRGFDIKNNEINELADFEENIDILVTLGKYVQPMFVPKSAKMSWNSSLYEDDLEKTRDVLEKDVLRLMIDIKKGKY